MQNTWPNQAVLHIYGTLRPSTLRCRAASRPLIEKPPGAKLADAYRTRKRKKHLHVAIYKYIFFSLFFFLPAPPLLPPPPRQLEREVVSTIASPYSDIIHEMPSGQSGPENPLKLFNSLLKEKTAGSSNTRERKNVSENLLEKLGTDPDIGLAVTPVLGTPRLCVTEWSPNSLA